MAAIAIGLSPLSARCCGVTSARTARGGPALSLWAMGGMPVPNFALVCGALLGGVSVLVILAYGGIPMAIVAIVAFVCGALFGGAASVLIILAYGMLHARRRRRAE